MNKPILLLDVDGVITDHNDEFLNDINELFGKSYTVDDITSWDYSFLEKEERDYLHKCWENCSYDDRRIDDEDFNVLQALQSYCRVVVCSTPFAGHIESKYRFLLRYFTRNDIILCGDKNLAGGDILVDDSERNIRRFRDAGGYGIIFDQPWNQDVRGPRAMDFESIGPFVVDFMMERGINDFGL